METSNYGAEIMTGVINQSAPDPAGSNPRKYKTPTIRRPRPSLADEHASTAFASSATPTSARNIQVLATGRKPRALRSIACSDPARRGLNYGGTGSRLLH